jgi:hypothetical protein
VLLPASVASLGNGQVNNTPMAFCLLLGLFLSTKKKPLPAWYWVLALVFICIKTHYLIMLLPFIVYRKNWWNLVVGCLGFGAFVALFYWLEPAIFSYYQLALAGKIDGGNMALSPPMLSNMMRGPNWALSGLLKRVLFFMAYTFGSKATIEHLFPYYSLTGLGVLGGILLLNVKSLLRQQWEPTLAMATLGLWAFCFGPVSWWHYLIFLYPLVLLSSLKHPSKVSAFSLVLIAGINVLTIFQNTFYYDFLMVNRLLTGVQWVLSNSIFVFLMVGLFALVLFVRDRGFKTSPNSASNPHI